MENIHVRLRPLVSNINLPTVLKTAILPGESIERLFIATQVGEIFYLADRSVEVFLDLRSRIISLGGRGGYDERGLLGLAFHPRFQTNGLFYLHYSLVGTQGPGAPYGNFIPNPCDPSTLNLEWTNRETRYDHIDTVEEWVIPSNGQPLRRRTLLNLRRPFMNHNGVNSLNFSPETRRLVLTTGDGGSGYDPFNLSQNDQEIAGKIIEFDVDRNVSIPNPPAVTRFNELPREIQETLTVTAKGVRNILGISYQQVNDQYIKYIGNVGQDLVESVFAYTEHTPVPVTQITGGSINLDQKGIVNFGWRGWEGELPTSFISPCPNKPTIDHTIIAYFNEAVATSDRRLRPLTCHYHIDPRPETVTGEALTGVQYYRGNTISKLTGSVVFTDFINSRRSQGPVRGFIGYTRVEPNCQSKDFGLITTDEPFGSNNAFYMSLGTNLDQTRLFLGVYGSSKVTDTNLGTVYELVP